MTYQKHHEVMKAVQSVLFKYTGQANDEELVSKINAELNAVFDNVVLPQKLRCYVEYDKENPAASTLMPVDLFSAVALIAAQHRFPLPYQISETATSYTFPNGVVVEKYEGQYTVLSTGQVKHV